MQSAIEDEVLMRVIVPLGRRITHVLLIRYASYWQCLIMFMIGQFMIRVIPETKQINYKTLNLTVDAVFGGNGTALPREKNDKTITFGKKRLRSRVD